MSVGYKDEKVSVCGCRVATHIESGVTTSTLKCLAHLNVAGRKGLKFQYEVAGMKEPYDIPNHFIHEEELLVALHSMGVMVPTVSFLDVPRRALEIGAGLGQFCPFFLRRGYHYAAVEPDIESARWIEGVFGVPVFCVSWEAWDPSLIPAYEFILASHVVEHIIDMPAALRKVWLALKAGGKFICVVPDDQDLWNPDHHWFFTEATLKKALEKAGFEDVRVCAKRIVQKEMFLYAVGTKR